MKKQTEYLNCGRLVDPKQAPECQPYTHDENYYRQWGSYWSNVLLVSNDECPMCRYTVAPVARGSLSLSLVAEDAVCARLTRHSGNLTAIRTLSRWLFALFGSVILLKIVRREEPLYTLAIEFAAFSVLLVWDLVRQRYDRRDKRVR